MLEDFKKEMFDILIQAGQSNAKGTGYGEADDPWQPDDSVWMMNADLTLSRAEESVCGSEIRSNFAFAFAREYLNARRLAGERKLLILRTASSNTGFLDGRWRPGDDLYLRMTDMIRTSLALNPENRPVALLWHQGETDAGLGASYPTHYDNLMTFVRSVRSFVGRDDLPFIAGDFVHHWKNGNLASAAPVAAAIRAVCRDCGRAAFVTTDGLLSNRQELNRDPEGWYDPVHFSRRALYELGIRYYKAFEAIVQKTK